MKNELASNKSEEIQLNELKKLETNGAHSKRHRNEKISIDDLEKLIKDLKIDPDAIIKEPDSALRIKNDDGSETILGSLGNISMIKGKPKSRKTFLAVAMTAAVISNGTILGKIKGCLPENKPIVDFFDTEQSYYHCQLMANRIIVLAGDSNRNKLNYFNLRGCTIEEMKQIVEHRIQTVKELGTVCIDGIRDFLDDINSPSESTTIKDWLLELSAKYNIHIIVVLHTNKGKGDDNARGHIGSEMENKCETVISVTVNQYNPDISIVKGALTRNIGFEDFAFYIDDNGLPKSTCIPNKKNNPDNRKISPEELPKETQNDIINRLFQNKDEFNSKSLVYEIMNQLKIIGHNIGERKAGDFKDYWLKLGLIIDNGTGRERKYVISPGFNGS